jgi:hypothetical protein
MIKTLRLTGVAAVAFAGLVLASLLGPVSLIRLDGRNDQQMGKVLNAPGAVERFRELQGDKTTTNKDSKPPLVVQAELFKNIIDPKLPPAAPAAPTQSSAPRTAQAVKPPVPTSAKFTLIGTSCSPSNPNSSIAYVRSMDNTCQWVRCGSEIGYLTIKEVREGSVICWDGRRESEIPIEVVPDRVAMLEGREAAPASTTTPATAPQPVGVKVLGVPASQPRLPVRSALPQPQSAAPKMNEDEHKAMSEIVDRLKQSSNTGGPATEAERRALANMISELKSSRVSPQETRKLEDMGDGAAADSGGQVKEEASREILKRLNAARAPQE